MKQVWTNRLVLCLLTLGALAGCSKTTVETTVPQTWKNASYQGPRFEKLLIMGVARFEERRRLFEDSLETSLASEDVASEASWKSLPTPELLDTAEIRNVVTAGNFDGVLITRLVDVDVKVESGNDPLSGAPMYATYRESYDEVRDPNFFDPNADYRVQTALYSAESEELVWVARSVTAKPPSVEEGIDSMTRTMARTLKEDGLVAPAAP